MGLDDVHSLKPENFNGSGFNRWIEQMEAWLIALGLITALGKKAPYPVNQEAGEGSSKTKRSAGEIEFHCRFRILSCLSNELYETYQKFEKTKDLWNALDDAYSRDNEGIVRFTISDFHNYKMVDEFSINEQIHKFQNMIQEIHRGGGTKLDKNYQVTCLIYKLPPSWSKFAQDFRKSQMKLDMSSVIQSIRIDDQFRIRQSKENQMTSRVHLTEKQNINKNKNYKNQNQNHKFHGRKFNKNQTFSKTKYPNNKSKEYARPNYEKKENNYQFCYVCG
jgi:gag-polypeptide of LTR copia-type